MVWKKTFWILLVRDQNVCFSVQCQRLSMHPLSFNHYFMYTEVQFFTAKVQLTYQYLTPSSVNHRLWILPFRQIAPPSRYRSSRLSSMQADTAAAPTSLHQTPQFQLKLTALVSCSGKNKPIYVNAWRQLAYTTNKWAPLYSLLKPLLLICKSYLLPELRD